MWKIEKFGKSLKSWKFGIILKNIFYCRKTKSGKVLKNILEFEQSDFNLVKSVKNRKFGKSLKSWKFGIILKSIFYRGKKKSWKFLKNMLEFWESGKIWKNLVKSVKNLVKVWKVENLELFWKIFLNAEKWKVENFWKIC